MTEFTKLLIQLAFAVAGLGVEAVILWAYLNSPGYPPTEEDFR